MKKALKIELRNIWSLIKIIIGAVFIIIGLIGLILPILPGFIFIILGLLFLGNKKIIGYLKDLIEKTK